ncbi:prepilin peptidase [Occultella glacieicola]|uniref:Prepilin peptidase n=1 Tax=Occultella glacieicola TaxID=2518684 RepID=A0ABY2E1J2_9MICO|nr:A24 family peptidase [Occultella glacieicola]TDE92484.1 prepilin peptidase [Occultella glacieicola]
MGDPVVVLVCAALTGLVALALTPWLRVRCGEESTLPNSGLHAMLASLGGAGAAILADGWAELVALAVAALACSLLVVVDVATHRLPDVIVVPASAVVLLALVVAAATTGTWADLLRALAGAAAVGVGLLLLCLASPTGLGLGDVKLGALLGLVLGWTGWAAVAAGVLAAFVLGGLFAVILLATTKADRRTAVAFGPWLIAGAVVGMVWGPALLGMS